MPSPVKNLAVWYWDNSALFFIVDDFKPASVDTTKEALVEIGEGHHVTLTVPHVEVISSPKNFFIKYTSVICKRF